MINACKAKDSIVKHTDYINMKQRDTSHDTGSADFIRKFRHIWKITAALIILLYAGWSLLDAFVIPHNIITADDESRISAGRHSRSGEASRRERGVPSEEASPASEEEASPASEEEASPDPSGQTESDDILTEPVITGNSYKDGRISIEIRTMRTLDTDVYIADIILEDPSCLRTALAEDSFGRNLTETTSSMAARNNAILAINGDYYGFRDTGYVMRDSYLYRDVPARDPQQEDLVRYPDGSFEIVREADVTARQLKDSGAVDIFSFGPGLIIDGEVSVNAGDEVERAQVTNPRTAIGVISPLHYLFLVSDGRTKESTGLSLLELAELMKELGCESAYNLDGGGSSTIWFNGRVLNRPTTFGDAIAERSLSDILYIGQ